MPLGISLSTGMRKPTDRLSLLPCACFVTHAHEAELFSKFELQPKTMLFKADAPCHFMVLVCAYVCRPETQRRTFLDHFDQRFAPGLAPAAL